MRVHSLELDISASTYTPHALHQADREWNETNCYVDLWIEVLHAVGLDPVAAGVCTLSSDFEGDQWTMFKFSAADLWALYGIAVNELNVWRPLVDHVVEQLGFGRLLSMDVDSWYLPDTEGIAYRMVHQKTTIAAQMIDVERRRLGYFHNAGYFELEGEDFEGVLGLCLGEAAGEARGGRLPPYVEAVRLDRFRSNREPELATVKELVAAHLGRRARENPIRRFQDRIKSDLPWLVDQELETFHRYAFGTCRQCGANAEIAKAFVEWLDERDGGGLSDVADAFETISQGSKWLQFNLARAQRGREVSLDDRFEAMATAWDDAIAHLVDRYGT